MKRKRRKQNQKTQTIKVSKKPKLEENEVPKQDRFKIDPDSYNEIAIDYYGCDDLHSKIRLLDYCATIENGPPTIDESYDYLRYKGQTMCAYATVEVAPLLEGEAWRFGWIQGCRPDVTIQMTYGNKGMLTWEFQELLNGERMVINDSDGRHYPWYSGSATITRPCNTYQTKTISMADRLGGSVPWTTGRGKKPTLTNIFREQSFYSWFVAWDMTANKAYILKSYYWDMAFNIQVDPKQPLGQRAILTRGDVPEQPVQVDNVPIPRCALIPPCANSAQAMVLWPASGTLACIIPPIWKEDVPVEKQVNMDTFDSLLCKL